MEGKLGPWSSIDVHIEGEPLAKNGLRKHRERLETIVEPLLSASRRKGSSDCEILFKGKRRHLDRCPLFMPGKDRLAVFALQFLYSIESAWKAGDIDRVVRATFGFANEERDRQLVESAGVDGVSGAFEAATIRRGRRKAGEITAEKTRKRTPETEGLVRDTYATVKRGKVSHETAMKRTRAKLSAEHNINLSRTTIQNILKDVEANC